MRRFLVHMYGAAKKSPGSMRENSVKEYPPSFNDFLLRV